MNSSSSHTRGKRPPGPKSRRYSKKFGTKLGRRSDENRLACLLCNQLYLYTGPSNDHAKSTQGMGVETT